MIGSFTNLVRLPCPRRNKLGGATILTSASGRARGSALCEEASAPHRYCYRPSKAGQLVNIPRVNSLPPKSSRLWVHRNLGGSGGHISVGLYHSENPTTEKGMHTRSQQLFSGGRAINKAGADGGRFSVASTISASRSLL